MPIDPVSEYWARATLPAIQGLGDTFRDIEDRRRKAILEDEKRRREEALSRVEIGEYRLPAVTEERIRGPIGSQVDRLRMMGGVAPPIGLGRAGAIAPLETESRILRPEEVYSIYESPPAGAQFVPGPLAKPSLTELQANIYAQRQAAREAEREAELEIRHKNRLAEIAAAGAQARETKSVATPAQQKVLRPLSAFSGPHSVQLGRGVGGIPIRARGAASMLAGAADRLSEAAQLHDQGKITDQAAKEAIDDLRDFRLITDGKRPIGKSENVKLFQQQWQAATPREQASILSWIAGKLSGTATAGQ